MQVNQESNLIGRVVALERAVEAIRKLAGNTSSIISRGGLTLLNDSFVKMVDASGVQRVYIGHTSQYESYDQPVFFLRDANSRLRMALYDPKPVSDGYQPVFWVYDHIGNVAFTTDVNGGIAEPWLPIPVYPKAFPAAFMDSLGTDLNVPVSACTGGAAWEGRIGKVSHPRLQYDGVFGRMTGTTGSPTYSLKLNGVVVDSFAQTSYGATLRGPIDISAYLGQQNVVVQLVVSATGMGTDRIACQPNAMYLRQT